MANHTHRIPSKAPHGKERLIEVESLSRAGLKHFVSPDAKSCSCEAAAYGASDCSHRKIARVRLAKKSRKPKTCRSCGGYGRFLWGVQTLGDCSDCSGTGRAA